MKAKQRKPQNTVQSCVLFSIWLPWPAPTSIKPLENNEEEMLKLQQRMLTSKFHALRPY